MKNKLSLSSGQCRLVLAQIIMDWCCGNFSQTMSGQDGLSVAVSENKPGELWLCVAEDGRYEGNGSGPAFLFSFSVVWVQPGCFDCLISVWWGDGR